jgi:hypothetical protein
LLNAGFFAALSGLETFSPLLRLRAVEAAESWEALSPIYADRAALCSGPLFERMAAFNRLNQRGAYSEKSFWTFGMKGLVKDVVLGVVLADLVRKYGKQSSAIADRTCRRGQDSATHDVEMETRIAPAPVAAA